MAGTNKPATTTVVSSIISSILSSPSFAWLAVFVPALSYFVVTRFASVGGISIGGAARVGPVLTNHVQLFRRGNDNGNAACQSLSQLLYISSSCPSSSSSSTVNKNDPSSSSSSIISSSSIRLSQALLIAQRDGLEDIVASTWRHDEEIGRGYLLLSQSSGAGRVWRWEVGGGPFAIGKTLHLDQAGCRSNQHLNCHHPQQQQQQHHQVGSGGLAIDFGQERFTQGHLVVAEWGEGRIVRMQDNGARTPLLLHVPNLCETTTMITTSTTSNNNGGDDDNIEASQPTTSTKNSANDDSTFHRRRLHQPTQLLFTPFGDLMVLERNLGCISSISSTDNVDDNDDITDETSAIFIMRQAVHVPALTSLAHSRQAHSWTTLNHTSTSITSSSSSSSSDNDDVNDVVHVMLHHYQNKYKQTIGGMALTPQWTSIYVSTRLHHDGSVLLLEVPIVSSDDDDDDDDEKDGTTTSAKQKDINEKKAQMVLNLTQHLPLIQQAGPIAVSSQGFVVMAAPPYGLVLMHSPTTTTATTNASAAARVLGHLEIPHVPIPNTNSRTTTTTNAAANNNKNNTPMMLMTTITSLTLGEDGYLYMSTSPGGALLRLRIRDHPVKVPVNLVTNKKNK